MAEEFPVSRRSLVLYGFPQEKLGGICQKAKELLAKSGINTISMVERESRQLLQDFALDENEVHGRVTVFKEVTITFESDYVCLRARESLEALGAEHHSLRVRRALKTQERQAEREEVFSGRTVDAYTVEEATTEKDLIEFFQRAGPLSVKAGQYDVGTRNGAVDGEGQKTYIGVATYTDACSALKAVRELSGQNLRGRPVQVVLRSSQLVKEDPYCGPDGGREQAAFSQAVKRVQDDIRTLSTHLECGVCKDSESKDNLLQCARGHAFCEPCATHPSLKQFPWSRGRICPVCKGYFHHQRAAPR